MNFDEYISKGKILAKEENHKMAIENFQAAYNLQPDNEEVKQLLLNSLDAATSESLINEATHRINVFEGTRGVKITDLETTIKEFSDKIKLNPNASFQREFFGSNLTVFAKDVLGDALYIRSLYALSKKDNKLCLEDLNKAIEYIPDNPKFLNKRGIASENIGDYDQAITDYKKWIEIMPDDNKPKQKLVTAYCNRGVIRFKKGDLNGSIADFEACLKIDANNEQAIGCLKFVKSKQ
ncbi:MAG: hypothetical protein FWC03_07580 [Treponema sp.]|nr:hypothetical protein [Treponema sp.]